MWGVPIAPLGRKLPTAKFGEAGATDVGSRGPAKPTQAAKAWRRWRSNVRNSNAAGMEVSRLLQRHESRDRQRRVRRARRCGELRPRGIDESRRRSHYGIRRQHARGRGRRARMETGRRMNPACAKPTKPWGAAKGRSGRAVGPDRCAAERRRSQAPDGRRDKQGSAPEDAKRQRYGDDVGGSPVRRTGLKAPTEPRPLFHSLPH